MRRRTILVVDDEESQRDLMRHVLELEDYAVLEAPDYDEALAVQARHSREIDLLLIDLSLLPGRSGFDLSREMLAIEPHLAVLFVSGPTGAELRKAFDTPVTEAQFLLKPFLPHELVLRVKMLLKLAGALAGTAAV